MSGRPIDPAEPIEWFNRWMAGETYKEIGESVGRNPSVVTFKCSMVWRKVIRKLNKEHPLGLDDLCHNIILSDKQKAARAKRRERSGTHDKTIS